MLPSTLRAARPSRVRAQMPALRRQAQPSAPFTTRIPSPSRPSVAAKAPCGHFQIVFHTRMSTRTPLQSNKVGKTAEGDAEPGKPGPRPNKATSSSDARQALDSTQADVEPPSEMVTELKSDLVRSLSSPIPSLYTSHPVSEHRQGNICLVQRTPTGLRAGPCRHPSLPSHLRVHRLPLLEPQHPMAEPVDVSQSLPIQPRIGSTMAAIP